jgi:ribonuclease BN (tRNA processing enzyme)
MELTDEIPLLFDASIFPIYQPLAESSIGALERTRGEVLETGFFQSCEKGELLIMRITILGSGTAIPDGERGSPGIAVAVEGFLLFLDLGSGSLGRAARFGLPVDEVDFVLFSHLHPDHTADLVPLLFAFRNPEWCRSKPLRIAGPEGLGDQLRRLEDIYGSWIQPAGYAREVLELEQSRLSFEAWHLESRPVRHGPPSIAYAILDSRGRKLVYSGDTEYCEEIVEFAGDADLLILECSFPDGRICPGHLTPSQAGRIAGGAQCKHLLLTHFYPACRGHDLIGSCTQHFGGPVTLAKDGLRMDL